jgi:hypothetical protein
MVRPHKHAYNGIIVYYMVKKQTEYSYDTNIGKFTNDPGFNYRLTRDIKYVPVTVTPTELYNEIGHMKKKYRWPTMMSWKTLVKYLGEMVKEHTLVEYPTGHTKNNEHHYRLSENKLFDCISYLHRRVIRHGPIGSRIYSRALLNDLWFELYKVCYAGLYYQNLRMGSPSFSL